jgi:outer membrane protein OmpA-like peptidoglycan-associated protein
MQGAEQTAYRICADVLFALDRSTIRSRAVRTLGQIAHSIARRHVGRAIRVDGHTDSTGNAAYNLRLSRRRSAAVKRWLVAHTRIPARSITVTGYGETQPVASNATAAGRARNRRVVVGVAAAG